VFVEQILVGSESEERWNRVEPFEMERQDDKHPGVVAASQSVSVDV
jgi:hypothetical protein